jgi:hypothetical protein
MTLGRSRRDSVHRLLGVPRDGARLLVAGFALLRPCNLGLRCRIRLVGWSSQDGRQRRSGCDPASSSVALSSASELPSSSFPGRSTPLPSTYLPKGHPRSTAPDSHQSAISTDSSRTIKVPNGLEINPQNGERQGLLDKRSRSEPSAAPPNVTPCACACSERDLLSKSP